MELIITSKVAVASEGYLFVLQVWLDLWAEWKWKNYSFAGLPPLFGALSSHCYTLSRIQLSYTIFPTQLTAGLSKPTSGSIFIQRYGDDGKPNQSPELLSPERVGLVFQFPERY